jgi:hypothetical protein
MDLDRFRTSLREAAPPVDLPLALQAMWWDGKGDWDKAHGCAQDQEDQWGDWVHAYLHRKEGDLGNAGYWYRRVKRPVSEVTLEAEWLEIVSALLAHSAG